MEERTVLNSENKNTLVCLGLGSLALNYRQEFASTLFVCTILIAESLRHHLFFLVDSIMKHDDQ